MRNVSDVIVAH